MERTCASVYAWPGVQETTDSVSKKTLLLIFKVYYPLFKAYSLLFKVFLALSCAADKGPQTAPHRRDQYGPAMQPSGIFWTLRRQTTSRRQESQKPLREDSASFRRKRWLRRSSRLRGG